MNKGIILHIVAAVLLLVTFFLPWLVWKETILSGASMPVGSFFTAAKNNYDVANPFPQFSFAFKIFWMIPAAAIVVVVFTLSKKSTFLPAAFASLLSLSLVLVYFLFSKNLVDLLGISKSVWVLVKPWIFVQALAAILLLLSAGEGKWILKISFIVLTVLATYFGFNIVSEQAQQKVMNEQFNSSEGTTTDYTISATELLKEFKANDSVTNKKYVEKMVEVSGIPASIDIAADSIATIRFEDSTGSFADFTLEKNQYHKVKNINAGTPVTIKGVCSGSIYSDILENTQISFKRAVIK